MKRLMMLLCLLALLPACRPTTDLTPLLTVTAPLEPTQTPTSVPETPTAVPSATPTQTSTPTPTPTHPATPVPTPFLPEMLTGPADLRQPVGRIPWYRGDGLWLVDPETGDLQRVQMAAQVAAWSPRDDYLAVLEPPLPGQDAPADVCVLTVYDLAARQHRTYPNVHVAAHGGLAWQETGGTLALYVMPTKAPACLLRFDPSRGEFQQTLCTESDANVRFVGDVVALPDGGLAHTAISTDRVDLRLVDPTTGAAQDIPLWAGSDAASALHVPLSLSPDGRLLAALLGPDADPEDRQVEQQGLYLLDVDASKADEKHPAEKAFAQPGLRWMAWAPDGTQLALAGNAQGFGMNAIHLYNRATGVTRSLYEADNYLHSTFIASSPVSANPASAC